ncbi:M24 family metallopeptidase [Phytoactinopolyspora limicola]|uniref:M24 family metallopeptidase n=1 Tax=Phytoactinopolyspora limicola TaxID=2715536 RepID=UPI00140B9DDE|nr:M24 family metallopeptidase [Phytoactinopolyspora limicola]
MIDTDLRFTDAEWQRRARVLREIAEAHDVAHVLLYGADRSGTSVPWLTGWPVTREALVVWSTDDEPVLFVQFRNHVPQASSMVDRAEVRWGGSCTVQSAVDELERRRAGRRVGVIGPLSYTSYRILVAAGYEVTSLDAAYVDARLIKSAEEIRFLSRGAELSDAGLAGLIDAAHPGVSERELINSIERAYVPNGGGTHIHYLMSTPMSRPSRCVPAQRPSKRRLERGDVVVTEISADYQGYAGQVLRTITVDSEPTAQYAEMHEVAQVTFERICAVLRDGTTAEEVIEAASSIEAAGLTICDDLVHGYGGGYLPPILGSRSQPHHQGSHVGFAAGMTVVVQPNVVTADGQAGVQTGELVHVTSTGVERLHSAPRGILSSAH